MAEINWTTVKERTKTLGKWTYWIVGLIIAATISYVLYTRFNKQVAALLVFMSSVLALYYYYVKWFIISSYDLPISLCPDFLTNVGNVGTTDKPQFLCVDYIGVSKDFNTAVTSPITDAQKASVTKPLTGAVSSLGGVGVGGAAAGYVVTPVTSATLDEMTSFCKKLSDAGLSWIGRC